MDAITFKNIFYRGRVVFEDELIRHYHTEELLVYYSGNFLQFKRMPRIDEWLRAFEYLREFHVKNGQNHVKFLFPENEEIPVELLHTMKSSGFDIGFVELYVIEPRKFPLAPVTAKINVQKVTEENWQDFAQLNFEVDSKFGEAFAIGKRDMHERNLNDERFLQLIAYYDNVPAGTVDIIIGKNTAEIDGLVVLDSYQKKGIGTQLQQFVMNEFSDKTVILVADGEDTPREMYKKQNYQYRGKKYEALKVFSD